MSAPAQLGIIGGSGLYALSSFSGEERLIVDTPFGAPASEVVVGSLNGVRVAFLSRHGPGHRLSPSEVPYAANIYAMKSLGVTHLLSVSAVGSLRERLEPRSFCIPDNLIDRTVGRQRSFFGDGVVAHVSMAEPFCGDFSARLTAAARSASSLPVHEGGSYVCIEGPQFSTRAESELFRSWGASTIGMTALPEARLAREAELCYACLAMVTDYDVWHDSGEVSVELVIANLQAMTADVASIVENLAASADEGCDSRCGASLDNAIITAHDQIPQAAWERLGPITERYLSANQRA